MNRLLTLTFRLMFTLGMLSLAIIVGWGLWDYYMEAPWTRDGRVRVDVVAVAPDVSGLVKDVLVADNQDVRRGDVLFRIDPERFSLALRQAEAVVTGKQAADEQAAADYQRYSKLSDAAVTQQKLELARATALEAKAAYEQAMADRDVARLNLARSEVRASVNGRITNMDLRPGAYVSVGHGVMALIDSDTLRVEGYFEETKLPRIHIGDQATIRLMGEPAPLSGRVESIAGGIEDRERSAGANLLANVNPTFSWVRLAQRVPVRIALDQVPDGVRLIAGRTTTVSIDSHDDAPQPFPLKLWRTMTAKFSGQAG
ncbi:RND family efflux transporter, MFP subunit [Methylocella tundrae]|uniref:RND family efflux transporter, MFP subunit n=1 Tax=Methylocella tundrae TaxID=227605 RepID=A0A8B6M7A1_METTU|nr:HlyD family secretion protein [Methylocella tundrae]VTZ26560.1 RND family efflux transporter, MFP subunit [Methylocella tundrae]VTZ50677.1 RND family efflux transporter, MFP subunit [Methylocella tundrae]